MAAGDRDAKSSPCAARRPVGATGGLRRRIFAECHGIEKRRLAFPVHGTTILRAAAHARRATTISRLPKQSAASADGSRCCSPAAPCDRLASARSLPRIDTKVALPAACYVPPASCLALVSALYSKGLHDLKVPPKIRGLGRPSPRRRVARLAKIAPAIHRKVIKLAGLDRCRWVNGCDDMSAPSFFSASKIEHLPPTMPCSPPQPWLSSI